ncbi:hypothetical protein AB0I28_12185 [Phytomonospora sp. NPDC050363]|uniref:hypothetical protein n=1 Tax=Phytomonospora sp. NPDC050363 TaxID=3155642 RepID=UPI0033CB2FE1
MALTKEATRVLRAMVGAGESERTVPEWLRSLPFEAPVFVQAVAELGGKNPPLVSGRTVTVKDEEVHTVSVTEEGKRYAREETAPGVD